MEETAHIAVLPTPGMGHLIPLVEFAKRLIQLQHFKFSVTLIIPTTGPLSKAQKLFLEALPDGIAYIALPPVNFDDLADSVRAETRISLSITRSLSALREVVKSLSTNKKLVAMVVDLFGTDAFDVAVEFNISPFILYPSTATCLSLFLYLPQLDKKFACEYKDLVEPVEIPGCVPLRGEDLLDPVQDRKNDAYRWVLHHAKRYYLAEGIMVNSFQELEPGPVKALQQGVNHPPVYPIGPLTRMGASRSNDHEAAEDHSDCLKWLDDQPLGSVLYVSFGSGGTLSYQQLIELAIGLELSEQRFLCVIRKPNDIVSSAYFGNSEKLDPLAFLPKGFLDRVKGRGLLVPDWAPQVQILRHGSVGGFLTHCGWNSTLESIVNGVPLIAWPLYAEQRMNAVMLTQGLKVALQPKAGENGLVGGVKIANVVKSLMEGEEGKQLRSRMRELRDAAQKALISENGSSTKSLVQVASIWKSKISA